MAPVLTLMLMVLLFKVFTSVYGRHRLSDSYYSTGRLRWHTHHLHTYVLCADVDAHGLVAERALLSELGDNGDRIGCLISYVKLFLISARYYKLHN